MTTLIHAVRRANNVADFIPFCSQQCATHMGCYFSAEHETYEFDEICTGCGAAIPATL
jgi:hypothetical protein